MSQKTRQLIKKANLHKNWSIQTPFYSILNISAKCNQNLILLISSYAVSKLTRFLRHSLWCIRLVYAALPLQSHVMYVMLYLYSWMTIKAAVMIRVDPTPTTSLADVSVMWSCEQTHKDIIIRWSIYIIVRPVRRIGRFYNYYKHLLHTIQRLIKQWADNTV